MIFLGALHQQPTTSTLQMLATFHLVYIVDLLQSCIEVIAGVPLKKKKTALLHDVEFLLFVWSYVTQKLLIQAMVNFQLII